MRNKGYRPQGDMRPPAPPCGKSEVGRKEESMTDINEVLDLMILAIEKQHKIHDQFLKHIAILDARISVLEQENKELKNDKLNAQGHTIFDETDDVIDKFNRECKEFFDGVMKHGKNVE